MLPVDYEFGYVVGRAVLAAPDGTDADRFPDGKSVTGKATFKPSVDARVTDNYSALVLTPTYEAEFYRPLVPGLDLFPPGTLVDAQKKAGIWLPVGVYTVSLQIKEATVNHFQIEVTAAHTEAAPLDLFQAAPPMPGPGVTFLTVQVPAGGDPGQSLVRDTDGQLAWGTVAGGGGESLNLVTDGSTVTPPAGSAVGELVGYWLTTGSASVAGEPIGAGVHVFAWDGTVWVLLTGETTGPGGDVVPPYAGILSASGVTSTGFMLSVVDASDDVELHASPYSFKIGDGAWSAWQVSSAFTAEGLTEESEYSCVARVRDAAGNVSTGEPIAVVTGTAPPDPGAPTLSAAIEALSPVGYWKLDETTGTVATDSSGNGHHGTFVGDIALASRSGAPVFTGGYVDVPNSPDFSPSVGVGLSVFALAYLDGQRPSRQFMVAKGATNQYEWGADVSANTSVVETSILSKTGPVRMTETGAGLSPGAWRGFCFATPPVLHGARFPVYVDSGEPAQTTQGALTNSGEVGNGTAPLRIAGRADAAIGSWHGAIQHVAIFRAKLTDVQVETLMAAARTDGLIP